MLMLLEACINFPVPLIHDKIVELQKAHPSWQKTTPDFKKHFETYYE